MIDQGFLEEVCREHSLPFSQELGEKLDCYARLLVEWNQKMNLTAITEPREIILKHFADSLLLLKAVELPEGARLIDVGTGAGFPGVPVALARKDLKLTLLDSLQKRINFLEELTAALSLPAFAIHARAEEAGRNPAFREKFDGATARAVANLRELSEYCLPFVKVGGFFAALKGYDIEEELNEADYAIDRLGGAVEAVKKFRLGEDAARSIVVIRKVRRTPAEFPRISAKIKKDPLIPGKTGRK